MKFSLRKPINYKYFNGMNFNNSRIYIVRSISLGVEGRGEGEEMYAGFGWETLGIEANQRADGIILNRLFKDYD